MTHPTEDFDLLDRWREGDQRAGDELIRRHFDGLYRFLSGKVGEEIDDLLQRIFLACVESRDRLRKESSFRTYLFVVARNELYRHYRQRRRETEVLDFTTTSVADLGVSPSGQIAKNEQHRLLLAALRLISIDHQIALELYYWEGMSTVEVATVLSIPAGTVRSRLTNARRAVERAVRTLTQSPELLRSTVDDFERWVQSMQDKIGATGD